MGIAGSIPQTGISCEVGTKPSSNQATKFLSISCNANAPVAFCLRSNITCLSVLVNRILYYQITRKGTAMETADRLVKEI